MSICLLLVFTVQFTICSKRIVRTNLQFGNLAYMHSISRVIFNFNSPTQLDKSFTYLMGTRRFALRAETQLLVRTVIGRRVCATAGHSRQPPTRPRKQAASQRTAAVFPREIAQALWSPRRTCRRQRRGAGDGGGVERSYWRNHAQSGCDDCAVGSGGRMLGRPVVNIVGSIRLGGTNQGLQIRPMGRIGTISSVFF